MNKRGLNVMKMVNAKQCFIIFVQNIISYFLLVILGYKKTKKTTVRHVLERFTL